jgi:hypothetical protein
VAGFQVSISIPLWVSTEPLIVPSDMYLKTDRPKAGLTLSAISPSSDGAAILEKPVSDRGTLEDLSQSRNSDF